MRLNQITVPALDVERSIDFYVGLGLRLIVKALPHYARLETEDGQATLSLHQTEHPASEPSAVIYFECDELDSKVQSLRSSGYNFYQLPQDERWLWREARLRDPANNVLCFYFAGENRRFPPWRIQE